MLVVFQGTAGHFVSFLFTNLSCASVGIYNPDGTTLFIPEGLCSGLIDAIQLTQTGAYSIVISAGIATGTVTVYNAPPVTGAVTIGGPAVTSTLAVPGQNINLTFQGTAGQFASFLFTNLSCASVGVYNPDGTTLFGPEGLCSGLISATQLPQTGTHTIVINAGKTTGSITTQIYNAPPIIGIITVGGPPVNSTLTVPGQSINLTFSGTAEQSVSFTFTGLSCPTIGIYNPDGTTLFGPEGLCSGFINAEQLPQTGTYNVVISARSSTGTITTQISNAS